MGTTKTPPRPIVRPLFVKRRLFFDTITRQRVTVADVHDDFVVFSGYSDDVVTDGRLLVTRDVAKQEFRRIS